MHRPPKRTLGQIDGRPVGHRADFVDGPLGDCPFDADVTVVDFGWSANHVVCRCACGRGNVGRRRAHVHRMTGDEPGAWAYGESFRRPT